MTKLKILFLADIHGSVYYTGKALEVFEKTDASHIAILGDILNRGGWSHPREYNPEAVAGMLNGYGDRIIAVKGNCDSAEDAGVLNFPCMSDYSLILCGGRRFFITHGHIYDKNNFPGIGSGDVLLSGHTHIAGIECAGGGYFMNPGSVSLPKNGSPHSLGLLQDNAFLIKDIDGRVLEETCFDHSIQPGPGKT